jgi:hypothetical protein
VAQSGRLLGEVVPSGGVARLGRRAGVVLGGDARVPGPLAQAGAHRVEPVAAAEPRRELFDGAQPGQWAVDLADRDRAAERGDQVASEAEEFVVPGENLRSVGLPGGAGVAVQRGDGGLDLVLAAPVAGQGRLQDAHALGDLGRVPSGAVLLVEGDERAVLVGARRLLPAHGGRARPGRPCHRARHAGLDAHRGRVLQCRHCDRTNGLLGRPPQR